MDDAKRNAAIAARAKAKGLPEWQQAAAEAVGTDLLGDILRDSRRGPTRPSSMIPESAKGHVASPPIGNKGWVDPPKVDDWRPPGQRIVDAMLDAQDERDRQELVRKLKR